MDDKSDIIIDTHSSNITEFNLEAIMTIFTYYTMTVCEYTLPLITDILNVPLIIFLSIKLCSQISHNECCTVYGFPTLL